MARHCVDDGQDVQGSSERVRLGCLIGLDAHGVVRGFS
jgi:hypothetical protein